MDRFPTVAGRVAGAVAAAVILLATSSVQAHAARVVDFEGEVADAHGTSFSLTAKFRHGSPSALISFRSGDITLTCDSGTQTKRAHLFIPPQFRDIGWQDGSFSWKIGYVEIEPAAHRRGDAAGVNPFFRKDHVRGTIERRDASGVLWIRTFGQEEKGDCRSGRLSWTAERVRDQRAGEGSVTRQARTASANAGDIRSLAPGVGRVSITRR
jgi:hypothetical protein